MWEQIVINSDLIDSQSQLCDWEVLPIIFDDPPKEIRIQDLFYRIFFGIKICIRLTTQEIKEIIFDELLPLCVGGTNEGLALVGLITVLDWDLYGFVIPLIPVTLDLQIFAIQTNWLLIISHCLRISESFKIIWVTQLQWDVERPRGVNLVGLVAIVLITYRVHIDRFILNPEGKLHRVKFACELNVLLGRIIEVIGGCDVNFVVGKHSNVEQVLLSQSVDDGDAKHRKCDDDSWKGTDDEGFGPSFTLTMLKVVGAYVIWIIIKILH